MSERCGACCDPLPGAAPASAADRPEAGEITLCSVCGGFLVWQPDLTARLLTPDEFTGLVPGQRKALKRARIALTARWPVRDVWRRQERWKP